MKLEKLFWSSTKLDILKYLIFKRQWISMRALESELTWSFPAIKKQIDLLLDADIINVEKDTAKFSIYIKWWIHDLVKKFLLYNIESELSNLFKLYSKEIKNCYFWKTFWQPLDIDLVVIYCWIEWNILANLKHEINEIFKKNFIDIIQIVFMSENDFNNRYKFADKFVLSVLQNWRKLI